MFCSKIKTKLGSISVVSQENPCSSTNLGLYVHVPFCASTCDFCAFYQEAPDRDKMTLYLEGMIREMELRPLDRQIDTVFIGGGTPGVLTVKDWEQLGTALHRYWGNVAPREWSIEMAPSTIHPDKLALFKELGVTRISVGVQSFQDETLQALGRRQPVARIEKALTAIQEAGFPSWNLDLMFALPGQPWELWEKDLKTAIQWRPDHISTYCLTLEEDTPLYIRTLRSGKAPTEEEQAELYLRTWDFLGSHGYPQYEVSNFATPGHECLHNIHTWQMQEWLGLGPSAASQYRGRRWQNIPDTTQWHQQLQQGQLAETEISLLSNTDLAMDALIFGLRMNRGVEIDSWKQRFGEENTTPILEAILYQYGNQGLFADSPSHLQLTTQGRLVADAVATAILETVDTE